MGYTGETKYLDREEPEQLKPITRTPRSRATYKSTPTPKSSSSSKSGCFPAGCTSNILLGWLAVESCAYWLFDTTNPFWLNFVLGLVLGQFAFPLAVILFIMRHMFGVEMSPGMLVG